MPLYVLGVATSEVDEGLQLEEGMRREPVRDVKRLAPKARAQLFPGNVQPLFAHAGASYLFERVLHRSPDSKARLNA